MNHLIISSFIVECILIFITTVDSSWDPSIVEFKPFAPKADAQILRKAMKGFGTDEPAIIKVLMNRNLAQRKTILQEFKNMFKRDLLKDLQSELGGNLEDMVVAMFQNRYDFVASQLKFATKGIGTNEEILNELLCCRTASDMQLVKTAYKNYNHESLEKDIRSDTSGDYRKLLLALINTPRGTSSGDSEARDAALKIGKAGFSKIGTDEDTFVKVFSESSFPLIKKIDAEYFNITRRTLKDVVDSETSGDFSAGLTSIVNWAENPTKFHASILHSALSKRFVEKRTVMRIFVLRAEMDLKAINAVFLKMYNRSLESLINDKTSGDFRRALLAVLRGNA